MGIAGLGTASHLIVPFFDKVAGVSLAAGADLRPEARDAFAASHGVPVFDDVAAMCRSDAVDAVWIETPNNLHCEHTVAAAEAGKHVICAKPIAVTLAECDRMIEACARAGVRLLLGHSKVMDSPIRAMRGVLATGRLGRPIQVDSWNFTDWLQRPRLAAELDETLGGGFVQRQAPHQIDIVRYLAGGRALSVRAVAGRFDPNFDTEGNLSALLTFEGGAAATVSLNGYGWMDVTELTWNIGGMGDLRANPRPARLRRTGPMSAAEKFGDAGADAPARSRRHGDRPPFFGLTIVQCERGALRQSPDGLYEYGEAGRREMPVPPNPGRAAELIELRDALAEDRPVFPDGAWGKATLEVCLALLQSSREGREVALAHQIPAP